MGKFFSRTPILTFPFLCSVVYGACLLFLPQTAAAKAPEFIQSPDTQPIGGLSWSDSPVVIVSSDDSSHMPVARIQGTYEREDWTLISGGYILINPGSKKKSFVATIPLTGAQTHFEVIAVGASGKAERGSFAIKVDDWRSLLASMNAEKKTPFSLGTALTHISISQTQVQNFSEDALTLKASYQTVFFAPHWSLNADMFFTALPFHSSLDPYDARFLGLNLRMGYRVPLLKQSVEILFFGGVYYTTMFVTRDAFGYRNEIGPQLYPTVRGFLKNGDIISGYFKYSPVVGENGGFSQANREIASGVAWGHLLQSQHLVSVTFDWAQVNLALTDISSQFQCTSFTFGAAYSF